MKDLLQKLWKKVWSQIKKIIGRDKKKKNETPKPIQEELLNVGPRGLAMLHGQMGGAKTQIKTLTQIILDSKVKEPCVNVLCGGGFGANIPWLLDLVNTLNQGGRQLHLLLYMTNGPSQRHYSNTPVDGLFTRISPERLRDKIQSSTEYHQVFQDHCRKFVGIFERNSVLGGTNYVCPQLEDNLTNSAFGAMISLMEPIFPENVKRVRNACSGCYKGNESKVPEWVLKESHGAGISDKTAFYTNDGTTYLFDGEQTTYPRSIPLSGLSGTRKMCAIKRIPFILWSAKYQGLSNKTPAPALRDYVIPTARERAELIQFLQGEINK